MALLEHEAGIRELRIESHYLAVGKSSWDVRDVKRRTLALRNAELAELSAHLGVQA